MGDERVVTWVTSPRPWSRRRREKTKCASGRLGKAKQWQRDGEGWVLKGLARQAMRQFLTIAVNAFMELVRQTVFLVLLSLSAAFIVFLANVYYFALGDDPKMAKDRVLAVLFLSALSAAMFRAAPSV